MGYKFYKILPFRGVEMHHACAVCFAEVGRVVRKRLESFI